MEVKEFIPVSPELVSIIRFSNTLVKLKGSNSKLEENLKQAMEEDPDQLEKVVAYVFYLWFQVDNRLDLEDTNAVFKVSIQLVDIIDGVLIHHPEYWILQLLKYRIRSFMHFEEKTMVKDLQNLVAIQHEGDYPSYFLTMDILLSFAYFGLGDFKQAQETLDAIFPIYKGKITVLEEFFLQFIDEYRNIIKRSPDPEILDRLNKIQGLYF